MERETLSNINEKIRELIKSDDNLFLEKAIELIKAINNPLKCE